MLHKIIYKSIKLDKCDTKTSVFFFSSCQPAAIIITHCTNMRQYDVCELNISTIVEISDQSFMRTHLNNRKQIEKTRAQVQGNELKEEKGAKQEEEVRGIGLPLVSEKALMSSAVLSSQLKVFLVVKRKEETQRGGGIVCLVCSQPHTHTHTHVFKGREDGSGGRSLIVKSNTDPKSLRMRLNDQLSLCTSPLL